MCCLLRICIACDVRFVKFEVWGLEFAIRSQIGPNNSIAALATDTQNQNHIFASKNSASKRQFG